MFIFIFFGAAMLIALAITNYVLDEKRTSACEFIIRTTGIAGMCISFYIAHNQGHETDILKFILSAAMLICPQFFVSEYIQYRKNPNNIQLAQKVVKRAALSILADFIFFTAAIYCVYILK